MDQEADDFFSSLWNSEHNHEERHGIFIGTRPINGELVRESTLPVPELIHPERLESFEIGPDILGGSLLQRQQELPNYNEILDTLRLGDFNRLAARYQNRPFSTDINQFDIDVEPEDAATAIERRYPLRFPSTLTPAIWLAPRTAAEALAREGHEAIVTQMYRRYSASPLAIVRGFAYADRYDAAVRFRNYYNNIPLHRSTEPDLHELVNETMRGYAMNGNFDRVHEFLAAGSSINDAIRTFAMSGFSGHAETLVLERPTPDSVRALLTGLLRSGEHERATALLTHPNYHELVSASELLGEALRLRQYTLLLQWHERRLFDLTDFNTLLSNEANLGVLGFSHIEDRLSFYFAFHGTPLAGALSQLRYRTEEMNRIADMRRIMQADGNALSFAQALYLSNSLRRTQMWNMLVAGNALSARDAYSLITNTTTYQLLIRQRRDDVQFSPEQLEALQRLTSGILPMEVTRNILAFLSDERLMPVSDVGFDRLLTRQYARLGKKRKRVDNETDALSCAAQSLQKKSRRDDEPDPDNESFNHRRPLSL